MNPEFKIILFGDICVAAMRLWDGVTAIEPQLRRRYAPPNCGLRSFAAMRHVVAFIIAMALIFCVPIIITVAYDLLPLCGMLSRLGEFFVLISFCF